MKKAHLIGLGGAGVSAIAKYLVKEGYAVSGSDDTYSETIQELEEHYGVNYTGKHQGEAISGEIDMVIYTPAVGTGNVEWDKAAELGITMFSYPEYLGEISQYKKTIAIAGTNGKSTTTTMTAEVLVEQGFDPTVIVGAKTKKFDSNYRAGTSDLFLVEACEYKNSFLSLTPAILVITNVSPDHLDFFGDFETYLDAFTNLVKRMDAGSTLICPAEDTQFKNLVQLAKSKNIHVIDFTQQPVPILSIPGTYNQLNAQAAAAVVEVLGGDAEVAKTYLEKSFQGLSRRFEYMGQTDTGVEVVEDYAHNPEGLVMLIDGVHKLYPEKKIHMFFQPHEYPRTKEFFAEFTNALSGMDSLSILPIYKARKPIDESVSSNLLAQAISEQNKDSLVLTPQDFNEAVNVFNRDLADTIDLILVVGAGDVWNISRMLTKDSHGE